MTTATLLHMLTSLGQDPWVRGTLIIPFLLVVLDLVTGIGSALKRQAFSWKAFPQFIDTNLLRYLFGLFVMGSVNVVSGQEMAGMFAGFFGMAPITASLLASIRENFNEILPPKMAVLANQAMEQFNLTPDGSGFLLDQPMAQPPVLNLQRPALPPQTPMPVSTPVQPMQATPGFITTSFGGGGPLAASTTTVNPIIATNGPFATPGQ